MFLTELSASGVAPATHFISEGMIQDTLAYLLPLTTIVSGGIAAPAIATTAPGRPNDIFAAAQSIGLVVTLDQITTMLAAVDVSLQNPFAAMARLGLQLIRRPL